MNHSESLILLLRLVKLHKLLLLQTSKYILTSHMNHQESQLFQSSYFHLLNDLQIQLY